MTISIRSETGSFGTTANTTGLFTVPRPTNIQDNDYLVVVIGKQDDPNVSPPTGTGWVIGGQGGSATGNDRWGGIYYKKITGSSGEPASYTFDSVGSLEPYGCWSMALSGVDQTTPEDVDFDTGAGVWSSLSNDQTPNAPAVTVVTDGAMAFACWAVNAGTGTMPGGAWDTRVSNLNNGALFVASQTFAASGTSTGAPEIALAATGQESEVGMFVFRPALTTLAGTFSLGLNKGITESSIVSGTASESLPVSKALTTTSAQSSSNSLALPVSKGLQTSSEKVVTTSLELGLELGLESSSTSIISDIVLSVNSIFSEDISLDRVSGLSDSGQLSGTSSIALADILALQLSSDIPTTTDVILSLSDYIAESGTAQTTAQLTPPAGKSVTDFTAGLISDDTNPLLIDIASNRYTEIEWSIEFTSGVQYDDQYEFRVTITGSALTGYTQTPRLTVSAGGNIYTGTLSLDEVLNLTSTSQLIGVGNVTFSNILGLTESGNLVGIGTVSLGNSLGLSDLSQLSAIGTLGLGGLLGLVDTSQLSGTSALNINKYLSLADTAQLNAIASISLSDILGLILSGGSQVGGSISLDKILALSDSGLLTLDEDIGLDNLLGLSDSGLMSGTNALGLGKSLSLTDSSQLNAVANLELSETLELLLSGGLLVVGSLSLDKILALSNSGLLTAIGNVGISNLLGLSNSGLLSGTSQLSLNKSLSFTDSSQFDGVAHVDLSKSLGFNAFLGSIVLGSIDLSRTLSLSETTQLNAVASIGLSEFLALADSGKYSGTVSLSLGEALGITNISSATFIGTLSTDLILALSTSGVVGAHLYTANISLGSELGLLDTSQLDAVGTLTLTRVITFADGSTQVANVTTDLGKALAITLSANGIYGASFTLPKSLLIYLNSLVIPFGGMPTTQEGSLIISDTLYYTLSIWDENIPEITDDEAKELTMWDV